MDWAPRHRMAVRATVAFFVAGLLVSWVLAWASVCYVPFSTAHLRVRFRAGDEVYAHAWHRLRPAQYPPIPQHLVTAHERLGYRMVVCAAEGAATTPDGGTRALHSMMLVHAGWPWAAAEGARWTTMHRTRGGRASPKVVHSEDRGVGPVVVLRKPVSIENRFLPLRPRPAGLAADAIVWGGLLALPWLPCAVRRWLRERGGRCLACGYPAGRRPECSECGRALPAEVRRRAVHGSVCGDREGAR